MSELKQEYKALEAKTSRIDEQLDEVAAVVEAPENRAVLAKLDALLAEQDSVKRREEEVTSFLFRCQLSRGFCVLKCCGIWGRCFHNWTE
jgi:hypothetical protein